MTRIVTSKGVVIKVGGGHGGPGGAGPAGPAGATGPQGLPGGGGIDIGAMTPWTDKAYAPGSQVSHNGKAWWAVAPVSPGAVPGAAPGIWDELVLDKFAGQVTQAVTVLSDTINAVELQATELEYRWNDFLGDTPDVYEPTGTYSAGEVVRHAGKLWTASVDALTGVEPGTDVTKWADISYPASLTEFAKIIAEIGDVHHITAGSLVDHIRGLEGRLLALESAGGAPPVNPTQAFHPLADPTYSGSFLTLMLSDDQVSNVLVDPYDGQPHVWLVDGYIAGKSEADITDPDVAPVWVIGSDPNGQPGADLAHLATSVRGVTVGVLKKWLAEPHGTYLTVARTTVAGQEWLISDIKTGTAP